MECDSCKAKTPTDNGGVHCAAKLPLFPKKGHCHSYQHDGSEIFILGKIIGISEDTQATLDAQRLENEAYDSVIQRLIK
jgi:hypothetical protein